ncbi:hypothetical protein [Bacillus pumilus]|uniref:hypothetical protein n=1 Tax=Bacillus pumilus TaxID=1408 RepID=UPI002E240105|nr:hypothetical protein [Bacillus pumilus]
MIKEKFNRLQMAADYGAIPYVQRESQRIAHLVPDQTSFEQRCLNSIGYWLERYEGNGRDKKALIQRIIVRERNKYLKASRKEAALSIEGMRDDGNVSWEPEDVLADVEGEVVLKEKTALLAQGDLRKEMILTNWSRGCTNNTEIAMLLAQHFGGNIEGYRKYIQRFRLKCQRELAF